MTSKEYKDLAQERQKLRESIKNDTIKLQIIDWSLRKEDKSKKAFTGINLGNYKGKL